jgi:hypothetical protein
MQMSGYKIAKGMEVVKEKRLIVGTGGVRLLYE